MVDWGYSKSEIRKATKKNEKIQPLLVCKKDDSSTEAKDETVTVKGSSPHDNDDRPDYSDNPNSPAGWKACRAVALETVAPRRWVFSR